MTPRLPYRTDTLFGKSLKEYVGEKRAVALYATNNHDLICDGSKIFLSDGSHIYYFFLALLYYSRSVSIVTNSLGIAGEYVLRPRNVTRLEFPSNGEVFPNHGGIFNLNEDALKSELERSANIFISCEALESSLGICIDDAIRADIRRIAIKSGTPVTILCDHYTLSHQREFHEHAAVFTGEHIRSWQNFINGRYNRIITNVHPDIPKEYIQLRPDIRGPFHIPDKKPHSWQRYCLNARRFRESMGERFIEVDLETRETMQYKA